MPNWNEAIFVVFDDSRKYNWINDSMLLKIRFVLKTKIKVATFNNTQTCNETLFCPFHLKGRSQTTLARLFWPPSPLRWHVLWYERWQKVKNFGTTYLPRLVNVVCERPLKYSSSSVSISKKKSCQKINECLFYVGMSHGLWTLDD